MVISILSILSVASVAVYRGFTRNLVLDTAAQEIISDLKRTQARAISGEGGWKWGVRFWNGADDYYEIFSTPSDYSSASTTVTDTRYLPGNVIFTNPGGGAGSGTVALGWTNPGDSDFSNIVILRSTSAVSDKPSEGSSPNVNDTIGSSIVRYAANGVFLTDTSLASSTTYYYKIFSKDTNGNYDVVVAVGPFTPN